MLRITYKYMYLTNGGKEPELKDGILVAKALSISSNSIVSKVRKIIQEVTARGDTFISGHFEPSELIKNE